MPSSISTSHTSTSSSSVCACVCVTEKDRQTQTCTHAQVHNTICIFSFLQQMTVSMKSKDIYKCIYFHFTVESLQSIRNLHIMCKIIYTEKVNELCPFFSTNYCNVLSKHSQHLIRTQSASLW